MISRWCCVLMTFLFVLGDTQMGAVLWRASRACSYCNAVCLCLRFAVRRKSPSCASADACRSSDRRANRTEEHTSELQSLMRNTYADFCLQKKKNQTPSRTTNQTTY